MRNNKSRQEFLSGVTFVVNQIKLYGEKISEETVVATVLRSLTPKYDHVAAAAAIEESKDLSVFSFDELMSSLQAHDARMNRSTENVEEKAFQVKRKTFTQKDKSDNFVARGRGRGGFRGRGHGRGRRRG